MITITNLERNNLHSHVSIIRRYRSYFFCIGCSVVSMAALQDELRHPHHMSNHLSFYTLDNLKKNVETFQLIPTDKKFIC